MADNLHPDWRSTEADEVEIPVRDASKPAMQTISRRPAAIAGILLVVGIAALFMRSGESLRGQAVENDVIVIGIESIEPTTISAPAGSEVTWRNDQEIPQYLLSDTLCSSSSNECMNTSTMFQGDETTYTIPFDTPPGDYIYFSPTDPSLTGTITVTPGTGLATPPVPSSNSNGDNPAPATNTETSAADSVAQALTSAQQRLLDSIQKQLQVEQKTNRKPLAERLTSALTPSSAAPVVPGLEANPFTIGSDATAPGALTGGEGFVPVNQGPDTFANKKIQKPYKQPGTGAEVWVVGVLAIAMLWWVTRGYFVAYTE